jgi:hypothetical protein
MDMQSFNDGIEFRLLTNVIEHHHNMLMGSQNRDELRESLKPILKANYDRAMAIGEMYCVEAQELKRLSNLYACCIDGKFADEYAGTQKQIHADLSHNG